MLERLPKLSSRFNSTRALSPLVAALALSVATACNDTRNSASVEAIEATDTGMPDTQDTAYNDASVIPDAGGPDAPSFPDTTEDTLDTRDTDTDTPDAQDAAADILDADTFEPPLNPCDEFNIPYSPPSDILDSPNNHPNVQVGKYYLPSDLEEGIQVPTFWLDPSFESGYSVKVIVDGEEFQGETLADEVGNTTMVNLLEGPVTVGPNSEIELRMDYDSAPTETRRINMNGISITQGSGGGLFTFEQPLPGNLIGRSGTLDITETVLDYPEPIYGEQEYDNLHVRQLLLSNNGDEVQYFDWFRFLDYRVEALFPNMQALEILVNGESYLVVEDEGGTFYFDGNDWPVDIEPIALNPGESATVDVRASLYSDFSYGTRLNAGQLTTKVTHEHYCYESFASASRPEVDLCTMPNPENCEMSGAAEDMVEACELNRVINKCEIAQLITEELGLEERPGSADHLSDVPEDCLGAVGAVIEAGYMSANSDGSFDPFTSLTLASTLRVLYSVFNWSELEIEYPELTPEEEEILGRRWYREYVLLALALDIIDRDRIEGIGETEIRFDDFHSMLRRAHGACE